jgi:hypothetical protein
VDTRYPAITLNGRVFVETKPAHRRAPLRHTDALTKGIRVLAGSDATQAQLDRYAKDIDMGRISFTYGTAFADGSKFVPDL